MGQLELKALFIIVGVLFAVSIGATVSGVQSYEQQQETVDAVEEVSATVVDVEEVEKSNADRTPPTGPQITESIVTYEYEYDGETYTSTTVNPSGDTEIANTTAEEGDEITAHVNPENPEEAFLNAYVRPAGLWIAGVLTAFSGFITALLLSEQAEN